MDQRRRLRGSRATRPLAALIVALGIPALHGLALADEEADRAAARAHLNKGAQLLAERSYSDALVEFEEAYRTFPSPKIFFNIALADAGLSRNADAVRALDRFLADATDVGPDKLAQAREHREALLPKIARLDVEGRAGVEIVIDGRLVGPLPLPGSIYVDPGPHTLSTKTAEPSAPFVKVFEIAAGARETIAISGPPAPVVVATPSAVAPPATLPPARLVELDTPDQRPVYEKPWFWAVGAGVVVAVGLTLWLTLGRSSDYPSSTLGRMDLPP